MKLLITAALAVTLVACASSEPLVAGENIAMDAPQGKLIRCDNDATTWHDCYTASLRYCPDYYIAEHEHIVADGNVTFQNLYIRCK